MCVVHGAHEPRVSVKCCMSVAQVFQREERDGVSELVGHGGVGELVCSAVGEDSGGGGSLPVLVHEGPWWRR